MNSDPKAELRRPKEIRDPRSEKAIDGAGPRSRRFSLFARGGSFGFRVSDVGYRILAPIVSCLLPLTHLLAAQPLSDEALAQIRFEQKQNAQISLNLPFVDEDGSPVQLGQYFRQKPVVLVMGYYECPMLCTLVLNGLMESAADMKWSIGREFDVIDVSINPREKPALAAAKKRSYVQRYGRSGSAAGWHFLTADGYASRELANEVGFRYAHDQISGQYAHPSGLIILTPSGKVSGYLFGVAYPSKELYEALQRASLNRVSLSLRQFVLLCFHYNPVSGKYSGVILMILRGLGVATVIGMVCLVLVLVRRGHAARAMAGSEETKVTAGAAVMTDVSKL
jgi:protein SCO1/2